MAYCTRAFPRSTLFLRNDAKERRTKSFGTHVHNTSNNTSTSTKLQLQRIKLHIEIVNLKPVTPTTILIHDKAIVSAHNRPRAIATVGDCERSQSPTSDCDRGRL